MFEGPLEDRLAIRERIEAYGDAVFRHNADDWVAQWNDAAVWNVPGAQFQGKAEIKVAWEKAMEAFVVAGFFSTCGAIQVVGEQATARVYTREVLVDRQGKVTKIVGAYDDALTKSDGIWLFAARAYTILHLESAS